MLCVIVVLTSLIVLSHIGIDIAPLLAGAGVIGVAIGFGSQALVKDIITGLFILMEDQIAVGDVVDVGKDHAGVVEAISVRTIRLRDQAGTVHTVPFSEVTTVKNLTRDFAYAVARITISYSEDIDRVVEILRQVSAELMEDETLRPLILDPFDYQGVDALDTSSVVLLVRIRTIAAKQWVVGRAFNRLVKIAFDKHGIASRDPTPIVIVGAPARARRQRPGGRRSTPAPARLTPVSRSPSRARASTASISAQASTASATRRPNPARAKAASSRAGSAAARRNGPSRRRRAKAQAAARSGSGAAARRPETASATTAAATPFAASRARIAFSESPRRCSDATRPAA